MPTNDSDILLHNADLAVYKLADNSSITSGMTLTYTILVRNNGPSDAENVMLSGEFQEELTSIEFSADNGETWDEWESPYKIDLLSKDEEVTLLVRGIVQAEGLEENSPIVHTVTVISDNPDPNPTNNVSTSVILVESEYEPFANYSVVITASTNCVAPCNRITYTIVVANTGPIPAHNVLLTDDLPSEVTKGEFSIDNGRNWADWNGSVELGDIPVNSRITVLIRGVISTTAKDNIINDAEISSLTQDFSDWDNRSTVETRVVRRKAECDCPPPDEELEVVTQPGYECPEDDLPQAETAGNLFRAVSVDNLLKAETKIISNHTAIDVKGQFSRLIVDKKGSHERMPGLPYYVDGAAKIPLIGIDCSSTNHIQGYTQYYDPNIKDKIHFLFSRSHETRGSLNIKRNDDLKYTGIIQAPYSIKDKQHGKDAGWDHPSGIAALGQFLFVPWSGNEKTRIFVYDILKNFAVENEFEIGSNCVCLAVTDCVIAGEESVLLVIRRNSTEFAFFRSPKVEMCHMNFEPMNIIDIEGMSTEGMGLVTERNTGDVYWVVPYVTSTADYRFTNYVRLYKLSFQYRGDYVPEVPVTEVISPIPPYWPWIVGSPFYSLPACARTYPYCVPCKEAKNRGRWCTPRRGCNANAGEYCYYVEATEVMKSKRLQMDQTDTNGPDAIRARCGVHFRFGAGAFVRPDGRIILLATEKNPGSKGNLETNYFILSL